jgi:hypothetical protein
MNTKTLSLLIGSLLAATSLAPAQNVTNPPPPVITVTAPDAAAAEPSARGVFRVFREGATNRALSVLCVLDGTAANGVDYQAISNVISFRAGARVAEIPVIPIDDTKVEGPETVVLRLVPPIVAFPEYLVGTPATASVTLADNDTPPATNRPPVVNLLHPTNGAAFPVGADILLSANALDADGYVTQVEFFAGTNSLGVRTNNPLIMPPTSPFFLIWSNVPAGSHLLRAIATDDDGARAASDLVRITVETPQAVVSIHTADALATEPSSNAGQLDRAVFVVKRDRGTNIDLPVLLSIGGTAVNGEDYERITNRVVIPRGRTAVEVVLKARPDNLREGPESVVLRLQMSPACALAVWPPPPECYRIGEPAVAEARIVDADAPTNRPPLIELVKPDDSLSIPIGRPIGLLADTADVDGYVTLVEFFDGTNKLGAVTRNYLVPPPPGLHAAFQYIWSNAPLGRHELLARATDNEGASSVSSARHIAVVSDEPPPVTNTLPVVNLVALDGLAAEGTNCWNWSSVSSNRPPPACPTNVAVFAVKRLGPTNAALRVHYRIGGTAANGVDYVELTGAVGIPAGERLARIVVIPIDDRIREPLETVELGLVQATTDPSYQVGPQRRAAAVIVDNDSRRPTSSVLRDGMFHLQADAEDGTWLRIAASTNLLDWSEIGTCEVTDGALHFVDPEAQGTGPRFYRVQPALSPDLQ